MIFETEYDLVREQKAIETFVNLFNGRYSKLDKFDVDFKVFDLEDRLLCFVEVKGRNKNIKDAYPLPISVLKLVKLMDKKINPVIIWCCFDGIVYGKLKNISGVIKYGGRKEREGSAHDIELMAYYDRQTELKTIYFENSRNNI